jgi:guanylate kinase
MGRKMRHFLESLVNVPHIHYVYLSSYPVTKLTEQKEMNILEWIQSPVIFVMRGPICLKGVSELLTKGDGVIFDYELNKQIQNVQLTMSLKKAFVSPGILSFIQSDISERKSSHLTFQYKMDASKQMPKKQRSVLDLLVQNDNFKLYHIPSDRIYI